MNKIEDKQLIGRYVKCHTNKDDLVFNGILVNVSPTHYYIKLSDGDMMCIEKSTVTKIGIGVNVKDAKIMRYDVSAVSVTKEMTFASAHSLSHYEGKCSNLHGHNYTLQVTLEGIVDSIGFVCDFGKLKEYMSRCVDSVFDHKNLNDTLCFQSSAENMVTFIADFIHTCLVDDGLDNKVRVSKVKLWETPTSFAEWSVE